MATPKRPTSKLRLKSTSIDIVRTVDGAVLFFVNGARSTPANVRKLVDAALPPPRRKRATPPAA